MVIYGQKRMYGGSLFLVGFHVVGMSSGSWWSSAGLREDNNYCLHSPLDGQSQSKNSPILWEIGGFGYCFVWQDRHKV